MKPRGFFRHTASFAFGLCTMFLLVAAQPSQAVPLIANGGFEAGFTSWTVTDLAGGSGSWFIDDADGLTPSSGFATVGPAAGSFYAVTDQDGPGTHALEQLFTVPGAASSVLLSFDMFVNDQSLVGPIVNPAGLDHNASPNQHARVDILTAAAGAFDTGAGVLANFYLGVDAGANPHAYTSYSFDITALVGAGGTFKIRFAEVDDQFFFNQGVDNVSIEFTPSNVVIPEPSTMLLVASGLAGLLWQRRKAAHTK